MTNSCDLLTNLITPQVAMSLVPAFMSAYSMADDASKSIDFLGGELRTQIAPHLKNWALEFEIKRRAEKGLIPFHCEFVTNKSRNHSHVELLSGNWRLTVSQVCRPLDIPRESIFRNKHSLDGQLYFSASGIEEYDVSCENGRIYAILTHGWQTAIPAFINCGIPSSDMKSWVQHLDMLELLRDMATEDPLPPNDDIILEFNNHIDEKASNYSKEA